MFMRYEWGLAVGHTYTHPDSVSAIQSILGIRTNVEDARGQADEGEDGEPDEESDGDSIATDATSLRGFDDEEEERLMHLYGTIS